eukprot:gene3306-6547_t
MYEERFPILTNQGLKSFYPSVADVTEGTLNKSQICDQEGMLSGSSSVYSKLWECSLYHPEYHSIDSLIAVFTKIEETTQSAAAIQEEKRRTHQRDRQTADPPQLRMWTTYIPDQAQKTILRQFQQRTVRKTSPYANTCYEMDSDNAEN